MFNKMIAKLVAVIGIMCLALMSLTSAAMATNPPFELLDNDEVKDIVFSDGRIFRCPVDDNVNFVELLANYQINCVLIWGTCDVPYNLAVLPPEVYGCGDVDDQDPPVDDQDPPVDDQDPPVDLDDGRGSVFVTNPPPLVYVYGFGDPAFDGPAPRPAPPAELAFTGSDNGPLIAIGSSALVAGATLVWLGRRREGATALLG